MRTVVPHGQDVRPNLFYGDVGNGEFLVPDSGITYSDPRIKHYFEDQHAQLDSAMPSEPWLEVETQSVMESHAQNPFTILEGDLGAGKSTVLFGARTLLRSELEPYTLVNGHYLNREQLIANALIRAGIAGHTVIYDSFDYLFSKGAAAARTRAKVLPAIDGFLQQGGRIIATTHTPPWFTKNSKPELFGDFKDYTSTKNATKHRVVGMMHNRAELTDLCERIGNSDYANFYPDLALNSSEATARTYRVSKLVYKNLGSIGLENLDQDLFDKHIREIDDETRLKSGAPRNYSFI